MSVRLLEQEAVDDLPSEMGQVLAGRRFLRRMVSLEARGHVMLDSWSYIAMDALPASAVEQLEAGATPIGHILAPLWVQRRFRQGDMQLFQDLWAAVGHPDPGASRSYSILMPEGPCMVVGETFRGGALAVWSN